MEAKVIQCSVCANKMKITPAHFGKKIRCTKCQSVLVINEAGAVAKAIPAEGAAGAKASAKKSAGAKKSSAAAKKSGTAKKSQKGAKKSAKAAPAVKKAGKGELKPAKAIKKVQKGPKLNPKMKGKALNRVSAKERLEHLDDKGSRRMWTFAGVLFGLALVGSLVAYYMFAPEDSTKDETPQPVEMAAEVSVTSKETVTADVLTVANRDPESYSVEIFIRSTDDMEFVKIPAGEYQVGSPIADTERLETPASMVSVEEFYIGRNEVTNGQFLEFLDKLAEINRQKLLFQREADVWGLRDPEYARRMRRLASQHNSQVYDHPLQPESKSNHQPKGVAIGIRDADTTCYGVDWFDAYAYCNWANGMDPRRGILPTEIEWEIAARGQRGYLYPWGESPDDLDQVIERSVDAGMEPIEFVKKHYGDAGNAQGGLAEEPTEGVPPMNSYALINICGNAAELCWDRFADRLYEFVEKEKKPGFVPESPNAFDEFRAFQAKRAVRLSSVALDGPGELRYTRRTSYNPNQLKYLSFRCVYYERDATYLDELDACNTPDPDPDWKLEAPEMEKRSDESKEAFAERQAQAEKDVAADQKTLDNLQAKAREYKSSNGKAPTIWELKDLADVTEQECRRLLRGQPFVGASWFEDQ